MNLRPQTLNPKPTIQVTAAPEFTNRAFVLAVPRSAGGDSAGPSGRNHKRLPPPHLPGDRGVTEEPGGGGGGEEDAAHSLGGRDDDGQGLESIHPEL